MGKSNDHLSIRFSADKVKVFGPKVDGSFTVTFDVGEYEQKKVAELLGIPQQTMLSVTIELYDGKKD